MKTTNADTSSELDDATLDALVARVTGQAGTSRNGDDSAVTEMEDVLMQYAGMHPRDLDDRRQHILDGALRRVDEIEALVARRSVRKRWGMLIFGMVAGTAITTLAFQAWQASDRTTPVATSAPVSTVDARGLDSLRGTVRDLQFQYNVVADPSARRYPMAGTERAPGLYAQLFWNDITNVMYGDLSGLPALTQGETYVVWAMDGGTPDLIGIVPYDAHRTSSLVRIGCRELTPNVRVTRGVEGKAPVYDVNDVILVNGAK